MLICTCVVISVGSWKQGGCLAAKILLFSWAISLHTREPRLQNLQTVSKVGGSYDFSICSWLVMFPLLICALCLK